jgi:hypothetical protein
LQRRAAVHLRAAPRRIVAQRTTLLSIGWFDCVS